MATPAPPEPTAPARGFFQNLAGMYGSPRGEFAPILRRGAFWWPMLASVVVNLAFTVVWAQKVDVRAFMRAQIEASPRADRIPPDRMETIVETQSRMFRPIAFTSAVLGAPLVASLLGGLFLFVYRFMYAGDVSYRQSLCTVAWSFLTVGVVTVPLSLLTLALKGDWNVNPQEVLATNLGALVDKAAVARPLHALLSSLDLVSFWILFLLATGYGVATRRSTASALWGVGGCWALYVLVKVAWNALF
jgi:hypothetical protein